MRLDLTYTMVRQGFDILILASKLIAGNRKYAIYFKLKQYQQITNANMFRFFSFCHN